MPLALVNYNRIYAIQQAYFIAKHVLADIDGLQGGRGCEYTRQLVTTTAAQVIVPQHQHLQPRTSRVLLQQSFHDVPQPLVLDVVIARTIHERTQPSKQSGADYK